MASYLAALILLAAWPFPAGLQAAPLVVALQPGLGGTAYRDALRHYGLDDVSPDTAGTYRLLNNRSGLTCRQLDRLLRARGIARFVEPDGTCTVAALPNDPLFTRQWALRNTRFRTGRNGADIGAVDAWRYERPGRPVIVAVIDTGTDYLHPDLAAAMWRNPGEIPGNGRDDDGNGYADDVYGWNFYDNTADPMDITSHGTHCAGIIAAVRGNNTGVAGVCGGVRIMALRCASPLETLPWSATAAAVRYAADNGARIINASWGGYGYSQTLADAISYAAGKGVLFMAAAGNQGYDTDRYPFYPAGYGLPNIMAIAASDQFDRLTPWSNYGIRSTDLAAPGEEITSTVAGGGYAAWGGTSMAAPHVCGAAALLLAYAPQLSSAEIIRLLRSTAVPLAGTAGHGVGPANGRLNAAGALAAAEPHTAELPLPVRMYIQSIMDK